MCGVSGVYGGQLSAQERRAVLEPMLAQIAHRGPDEWGTYCSRELGLGHVRLSIVDLEGGHQPFRLGDYTLAFNGEIFNHIELRAELETLGEQFTTRSDTEVLLRALIRWGLDALPRLNGQFAFLFWDSKRSRLLAGRDRYGIRPLYHANQGDTVYFASEMSAYDAVPGFGRHLDPEGVLAHGLLWNTLADRTVYKGIQSIEAGTCAIFEDGKFKHSYRYHELGGAEPGKLPTTFVEAKEMLCERLEQAVRLRLRSDVPVGNYLSGGIDSSVITLLTDKLRSDTFRTFSIAFGDANYDESSFQNMMTERLDSDPFTLRIHDTDIEGGFEKVVSHAERPLFRTAPVPLYLLAEQVRKSGIRVVLTGEAADEILWGYDSYKELKLLRFWARHPESQLRPQLIRTLYPHLAHYRDNKRFGLMRMFYEGFLGSYDNTLVGLNMRVHNNGILARYIKQEHQADLPSDWIEQQVHATLPSKWSEWSLLQRNQYLEMRTLLQGYLLSSQGDRMSLAHGVEGRYPFLDHEVLEWAFHLPEAYKLPLLSQKHLLRESYRSELPEAIIDRPKQPYQAPDLKAFVRDGKLSPVVQEHLSEDAIARTGIFEPKMVKRFLSKTARMSTDNVGYRDNMLMCFMLSTQMLDSQCRRDVTQMAPTSPRSIDVVVGA